jgi:hypothetical protein
MPRGQRPVQVLSRGGCWDGDGNGLRCTAEQPQACSARSSLCTSRLPDLQREVERDLGGARLTQARYLALPSEEAAVLDRFGIRFG